MTYQYPITYLNEDNTLRFLIKRVHDTSTGDMWLELWDVAAQEYVTNCRGLLSFDALTALKERLNADYQHYENEINSYIKT